MGASNELRLGDSRNAIIANLRLLPYVNPDHPTSVKSREGKHSTQVLRALCVCGKVTCRLPDPTIVQRSSACYHVRVRIRIRRTHAGESPQTSSTPIPGPPGMDSLICARNFGCKRLSSGHENSDVIFYGSHLTFARSGKEATAPPRGSACPLSTRTKVAPVQIRSPRSTE
jgi:hypothetical protein